MPHVLLIDDVENEKEVLGEALKRRGYGVLLSSDGANGVLLYRSQAPEVVLVSVHVRQNRGWDILKRLKEQNPEVKMIVLGNISSKSRSVR